MKPILSIGITSYKRVKELERCINSIHTRYAEDIEVIISEDCSPLSQVIGEKVREIAKDVDYELKFMPNEHNLGYDGNLGAIIKKSRGEYIYFMSDDDTFYPGFLDLLIPFIKENKSKDYGIIYGSIAHSDKHLLRYYKENFIIEKGEKYAASHIYDSILFSGLIFKNDYVKGFDAKRFLNINYFQVYMFLKMINNYGGFYFSYPSVLVRGDGENAYGISESSGGNNVLADRTNVLSNLEFHKTLIKAIKMFDQEDHVHVFKSFEKQYSLHAYTLLSLARMNGKSLYKQFWAKMNTLDMKLYPITKFYYYFLLIFGTKVSNFFAYRVRKFIKKDEGE